MKFDYYVQKIDIFLSMDKTEDVVNRSVHYIFIYIGTRSSCNGDYRITNQDIFCVTVCCSFCD